MRISIRPVASVVCLCAGLLTVAVAQQPGSRPVPTLTSEDLLTVQPTTQRESKSADTKARTAQSGPVSPEDKAKQEAEKAWNDKLREAQLRVKDLERRADNAELEITTLRNQQFGIAAQDAGQSSRINARVGDLNQQVRTLRDQARTAQAAVDVLKKEGEASGFKVADVSTQLANGSASPADYQSRSAELNQDLRDADNRIQVIQMRINELNNRIRKNTGGVDANGNLTNSSDALSIRRLKTVLQDEQKKLAEAHQKRADAGRKIEELRRQAALAGSGQ